MIFVSCMTLSFQKSILAACPSAGLFLLCSFVFSRLAWLSKALYFCVSAYLEEIQSVRRHTNSSSDPKNTNLPVLVHCSAGVGRTGVVILSEIMIACLEHNEVHVSCAYSGMNASEIQCISPAFLRAGCDGYRGKQHTLLTTGRKKCYTSLHFC